MSRRPLRRGFTLLETLVALAILGAAVLIVLQLFSAVAASTHRHRAHAEGMALAQTAMERLMARAPAEVLAADGEEGSFPEPFPDYRYAVAARRVTERDLIEVRLHVTWTDAGGGRVELTTRVAGSGGVGRF